jgi:hypothetical protein
MIGGRWRRLPRGAMLGFHLSMQPRRGPDAAAVAHHGAPARQALAHGVLLLLARRDARQVEETR